MGMIEKLTKITDAIAYPGKFPVWYEYTLGPAGRVFAENLQRKGLLTGAKCPRCGHVYLPPRIYCENCFEDITDFLALAPIGVVETFTDVFEDLDGNRLKSPKRVAFIRICGSDGGLFAFVEDEVTIGDEVEAVLKEQREGTLKDILYFRRRNTP